MINYDAGQFGLCFILQLRGSVLPKALRFALPNAALAVLCHFLLHDGDDAESTDNEEGNSLLLGMNNVSVMWSSYTFVLGFLIVFRNNQAYQRFWQGAVTVSEISGDWFDAISCLFAFSNPSEERFVEVNQFQQFLLKLGSMLFAAALQNVCELEEGHLEVIELDGVDAEAIAYLQHAHCRVEVIMQWIQHLIVESDSDDILRVPAPILSRVFQELSNGMVRLHAVSCIKEIPFPFPYAQMITGMLLVHWVVTPLLASQVVQSAWWAGILCFCIIGAFWSLIFIALEIDQPFGRDANDLPIKTMMMDWNAKLMMLMEPVMQCRPQYVHRSAKKLGTTRLNSDFTVEGLTLGREELENSVAVMTKTPANKMAADKAKRRLRLSRLAETGDYDLGLLAPPDIDQSDAGDNSDAGSVCSDAGFQRAASPQSEASEVEGASAKRSGVYSKKDAGQVFMSLNFGAKAKKKTKNEKSGRTGSEEKIGSEGSSVNDRSADAEVGRSDSGSFCEAVHDRVPRGLTVDADGFAVSILLDADGFAVSTPHGGALDVHADADGRTQPTVLEHSVNSMRDVASGVEEHVKV